MKTFHNLKGLQITRGCADSDGNIVSGTEEDYVLLYNTSLFTDKQVSEMPGDDIIRYLQEGKMISVPKFVAENIAD